MCRSSRFVSPPSPPNKRWRGLSGDHMNKVILYILTFYAVIYALGAMMIGLRLYNMRRKP